MISEEDKAEITRIRRVRGRLEDLGAIRVAESVAAEYGVRAADILGRGMRHRIRAARSRLYMVIRHTCPDLTLRDLGAIFDVDHTAIHDAVHRNEVKLNGPGLARVRP